MASEFDVAVERDAESIYVASVPALPGCHTQASSLDELMDRVREVITLCLEEQGKPTEPLDFSSEPDLTRFPPADCES